jgi:hypothetical protein
MLRRPAGVIGRAQKEKTRAVHTGAGKLDGFWIVRGFVSERAR